MALDLRLPKEPTYRIRFAEDDDDEFFSPADMGRMEPPWTPRDYPIVGGGFAVPGSYGWNFDGQFSTPIGKNTELLYGGSISHASGSKVGIEPRVGIKVSF